MKKGSSIWKETGKKKKRHLNLYLTKFHNLSDLPKLLNIAFVPFVTICRTNSKAILQIPKQQTKVQIDP